MKLKLLAKFFLLFVAVITVIFFAFYGIKSEKKEFLVDDVEKNLEAFEERGSFPTLAEDVSTEFGIELEKAKDIVGYIEDYFYDDLGEICKEHFEDMYYAPDDY